MFNAGFELFHKPIPSNVHLCFIAVDLSDLLHWNIDCRPPDFIHLCLVLLKTFVFYK